MKTKIYLLVVLTSLFVNVYSQEKIKDSTNYSILSVAQKMINDKPSNWKPNPIKKQFEHNLPQSKMVYENENPVLSRAVGPPPPTALTVFKGKNFEANNMNTDSPPDNFVAISNSGKIISVDNYAINEYNQNGLVSLGYSTWDFFFTDTALIGSFFDPKVVYDSYSDRFILIVLYHNTNFSDSRVLLAFSNAISTGYITWNFYQLTLPPLDYINTSNVKFWFDYPNIAINKNELFITSNVFKNTISTSTSTSHKTIVFEIEKFAGYLNTTTLPIKIFPNFLDNEGNPAFALYPLSEGYQDNSYLDKMYFVNNKTITPYKTFWYNLTGNISNSTVQKYTLTPSISLSSAPYANQLGSAIGDRIRISDNKIRGGYYKNGKIHYVFERSDQGWSEIAYGKINTALNPTTITPSTYGGFEFQKNYMYPSIACMSADGEKSIVTYALTEPTIYNQIWAVDNQLSNWGSPILIKNGLGLLSLVTYNSLATDPTKTYERIGDYTSIQRKYNTETAWLVGSYPFGSVPNINNTVNGLNAWISEVSLQPITPSNRFSKFVLFPNPNTNNFINISIDKELIGEYCEMIIKDFTGNQVFKKQLYISENTNTELPTLEKGIYFVSINSKTISYESQKLFIN